MRFRANAVPLAILAGVVALAPLPLGSVDPVFVALWCGALGLGTIALRPSGLQRAHLNMLAWAAALALSFVVVLGLQLIPVGFPASPAISAWWRDASTLLGEPAGVVASAVRDQGWYALGAPALCLLAFLNAFVLGVSAERGHFLLKWIGYVGAGYALLGILSFLIDPAYVLFFEKAAHRESLTATFLNRNTAAAYFGAVSIIWIVRFCSRLKRHAERSRRRYALLDPRDMSRAGLIDGGCALVCLIALFMTGSRAGIVLSLVAILAAVALILRARLARMRAIKVIMGAAAALCALWLVLGGSVAQRIALEGLSDGGRFGIYVSSLEAAKESWLLGTGLGTYRRAFTPYRPDDLPTWGIWDRAHNSLLEIAVEMGVPFALAVLVTALAILVALFRRSAQGRDDNTTPICGFAAALLCFAHSLVDFPLQIPGLAVTTFVIIGAGLACLPRAARAHVNVG